MTWLFLGILALLPIFVCIIAIAFVLLICLAPFLFFSKKDS